MHFTCNNIKIIISYSIKNKIYILSLELFVSTEEVPMIRNVIIGLGGFSRISFFTVKTKEVFLFII